MPPSSTTGKCLCGLISIEVPTLSQHADICHCGMCRKWSAGPFLAIECHEEITITGQEHLATYKSSEWAERVFCKNCGSSLFYKLKDSNFRALSAGLFDRQNFTLEKQIFIDEKPDYYDLLNDTPKLTGQQVFENAQKE